MENKEPSREKDYYSIIGPLKVDRDESADFAFGLCALHDRIRQASSSADPLVTAQPFVPSAGSRLLRRDLRRVYRLRLCRRRRRRRRGHQEFCSGSMKEKPAKKQLQKPEQQRL